MEYQIDPIIWFGDRRLDYPPGHFIMATTLLTPDSLHWVLNSLRGRYAITLNSNNFFFSAIDNLGNISFEDPSEATLYELRWS